MQGGGSRTVYPPRITTEEDFDLYDNWQSKEKTKLDDKLEVYRKIFDRKDST